MLLIKLCDSNPRDSVWHSLSLRYPLFPASLGLMMLIGTSLSASVQADQVQDDLAAITAIGAAGEGYDSAMAAADRLRGQELSRLPMVLNGMRDASPVAQNWLRGIARDLVRRAGESPAKTLIEFATDQDNAPAGRATAIDLLQKVAPEEASKLVRVSLQDPSLLIREKAVADAMEMASSLESENKDQAIAKYRETLVAARHPQQLSTIISALNDLGDPVTTAEAFSMVKPWQAVAPFDNVDGVGFDRVYPPEAEFADSGRIDDDATFDGKNGEISWEPVIGDDKEGKVNLADAFNKEKGAVAYVYTEFPSAQSQAAQIRLGCINANKVWLNGKEVMSNEVYHSGSMIDQYVADVTLQEGVNRILMKICQNEQTESWAQEWEFQFRLTDLTGKGLTAE